MIPKASLDGCGISVLRGLDNRTIAITTTLSRPTNFNLGSCNLLIKVNYTQLHYGCRTYEIRQHLSAYTLVTM
jgi:hypothetical protein